MKQLLLVFIAFITLTSSAVGAGIADYLILQDIGPFKLSKPEKAIPGFPPIGGPHTFNGAVALGDHFDSDHTDTTYEVEYYDFSKTYPSPTVQITQHGGGDSDKWLLHEIEDPFRDGEVATLGQLSEGSRIREINNNKVLYYWVGTVAYCWISGNVTVKIEYQNLMSSKPEPLEVVKAYLAQYPSTISITDKEFKSRDHQKQWRRDEITRRLWLSEKWISTIQPNDQLKNKLQNAVESMEVFLDYRDKYYGKFRRSTALEAEKTLLRNLLLKSDEKAIRAKLWEYQKWWDKKE